MARKIIMRCMLVASLSFGFLSLTACDKIVDYINNNCTSGEGSLSCGSDAGGEA